MFTKIIPLFVFSLLICACSDSAPKTETTPVQNKVNTVRVTQTEKKVITKNTTSSSSTIKKNNSNKSQITKQEKNKSSKTTTAFSRKANSTIKIQKSKNIPPPPVALFNHLQFEALLKKFVSNTGTVNYAALKKDHLLLKKYIENAANNKPPATASKNEKLAFWINIYNANTIHLILENYPTKSIMDLHNGKAWDEKFILIGKKMLSLNEIENEIIRPQFKDPRIHFAINCAAKSCPPLLNEAFLPKKLEVQLNTQTKKFINNVNNNYISENSIEISTIFDWYKPDFKTNGTIIDFLNKYSDIKINSSASIKYKKYNWALNE